MVAATTLKMFSALVKRVVAAAAAAAILLLRLFDELCRRPPNLRAVPLAATKAATEVVALVAYHSVITMIMNAALTIAPLAAELRRVL